MLIGTKVKEIAKKKGISLNQLEKDTKRESNQSFAQKINPYKKNSPIIFDTEEFDKWRLKKLRDENKAIRRDYF